MKVRYLEEGLRLQPHLRAGDAFAGSAEAPEGRDALCVRRLSCWGESWGELILPDRNPQCISHLERMLLGRSLRQDSASYSHSRRPPGATGKTSVVPGFAGPDLRDRDRRRFPASLRPLPPVRLSP